MRSSQTADSNIVIYLFSWFYKWFPIKYIFKKIKMLLYIIIMYDSHFHTVSSWGKNDHYIELFAFIYSPTHFEVIRID